MAFDRGGPVRRAKVIPRRTRARYISVKDTKTISLCCYSRAPLGDIPTRIIRFPRAVFGSLGRRSTVVRFTRRKNRGKTRSSRPSVRTDRTRSADTGRHRTNGPRARALPAAHARDRLATDAAESCVFCACFSNNITVVCCRRVYRQTPRLVQNIFCTRAAVPVVRICVWRDGAPWCPERCELHAEIAAASWPSPPPQFEISTTNRTYLFIYRTFNDASRRPPVRVFNSKFYHFLTYRQRVFVGIAVSLEFVIHVRRAACAPIHPDRRR